MSTPQTATQTYSLYGGDIVVEFNEGNHRYKVNGDYKSGVTTALSCLSKENLIQWAANKSVEAFRLAYTADGWTPEEFEKVCRQARYAHRTMKDEAAVIGKDIHQWVSDHVQGRDTPYEDIMRPSIESFLRWEDKTKPTYLFSERVVYSRQHDYCGTVDLGIKVNGRRIIDDVKTGHPEQEYKNGSYTGRLRARIEHFMQDGGYDQALAEEDGVFADAVGVIYLPLDGNIQVYEHDDTAFWREGFIKVLETFRFLKAANTTNEFQAA